MPWDPAVPEVRRPAAAARDRPAEPRRSRRSRRGVRPGCGAGNVTRVLAQRWPTARITGVDDSQAMLETARAAAPAITWQRANLRPMAAAATGRPALPPTPRSTGSTATTRSFPPCSTRSPPAASSPSRCRGTSRPRRTPPSPRRCGPAPGARRSSRCSAPSPSPSRPSTSISWRSAPPRSTCGRPNDLQVLEGEHPVKEWVKGTWFAPLLDALAEPDRSRLERTMRRWSRRRIRGGPTGSRCSRFGACPSWPGRAAKRAGVGVSAAMGPTRTDLFQRIVELIVATQDLTRATEEQTQVFCVLRRTSRD